MEIPAHSLRKLPAGAVAANQTPALCFCVTEDWAATMTTHLSCTIPDEAAPGQTLRIDTGHQDIDMPVPDGVQPGDKIRVTADGFVDDCIHTLVRRWSFRHALELEAELVRAVSALTSEQVEHLSEGVIFVLCGESVANSANVARLLSLLHAKKEQIVSADLHGQVELANQTS